jgi:hypothetical protein
MSKFGKLSTAIQKSQQRMTQALEREFPLGTNVRCYIMHGQVNPSRGQVIGYTGGSSALVRVRLESRTRDVRDVAAWDLSKASST